MWQRVHEVLTEALARVSEHPFARFRGFVLNRAFIGEEASHKQLLSVFRGPLTAETKPLYSVFFSEENTLRSALVTDMSLTKSALRRPYREGLKLRVEESVSLNVDLFPRGARLPPY